MHTRFFNERQELTAQQRLANHNATRKYLLLYCLICFGALIYDPNNKIQQYNNIAFILVALAHTYKALKLQTEVDNERQQNRRR